MKMYHPAFKADVEISSFPDSNVVKEPENDYWSAPFSPDPGTYYPHYGLDAYSTWHAPIYAVADGLVVETYIWKQGSSGRYGSVDSGTYVAIETYGCVGCKAVTVYKHLTDFSVFVGREVRAGEQIGRQGTTGNSSGEHLHFDLFIDDERYDPVPYLAGRKDWKIIRQQEETGVNIKVDATYKYVGTGWLNVRATPSASAPDVGDIYPGIPFKVTELQDAEGYTWGRMALGWCALYQGAEAWCEPVPATDCSQEVAKLEAQIRVLEANNTALTNDKKTLTAQNAVLQGTVNTQNTKITNGLTQAKETVAALS